MCLLACRSVDSGEIAGVFTISQIVRGAFQSAYLGYYAHERHAGQGLMREALEQVLDHAFGPLGLHRIEANIQPGNQPSIALARGAGFRLEGFSPRYLLIGGQWRDHERYAITGRRARGGVRVAASELRQRGLHGRRSARARAPLERMTPARRIDHRLRLGGRGSRPARAAAPSASSSREPREVLAQRLEHRRRVQRRRRVVDRVQPHRAAARSAAPPRARAAA